MLWRNHRVKRQRQAWHRGAHQRMSARDRRWHQRARLIGAHARAPLAARMRAIVARMAHDGVIAAHGKLNRSSIVSKSS